MKNACPHTEILTMDFPHIKQEAKHLSKTFEEVQVLNKNSRNYFTTT